MPLPKIATPTYELVLPSSNRKIKFRPFLVKEEKVLILAMDPKIRHKLLMQSKMSYLIVLLQEELKLTNYQLLILNICSLI